MGFYAKQSCCFNKRLVLLLTGILISFVALMLLFREMMYVNIAITVVYVFLIFIILFIRGKRMEA